MATHHCIFCQQHPKRWAEEHVTPQWLLDYLRISDEDQLFQGVAGTAEYDLKRDRVHSTRRFVEGRVCDKCNNGWMSRLETEAKPVLIELIDARRTVSSLTQPECAIISRWATKTAYVLANVSLADRPVQAAHLRQLSGDDGSIPAGVGVFGCQRPFEVPKSFLQLGFWPQIIRRNSPAASEWPDDAYKVGLQYQHLYLLVAFWPHQPFHYTVAAGWQNPILRGPMPMPAYVSPFDVTVGPGLPTLKLFADSLAVTRP